jgi:exodeoxyribonuclease III
MSFRIASWNINSVRLRKGLVARFLKADAPDVLCLQEIKTPKDAFPAEALAKAGYPHQAILGQSGYNGVAIVSRLPFKKTWTAEICERGHARHIAASFANGIELHNFYVPAGGDVPDPQLNDKFAHKLAFVSAMERYFGGMKNKAGALRIVLGDLNIAPLDNDVWSHRQLLDVVSHTPVEVEGLLRAKTSHDFLDATRAVVPEHEKIYSWWSYRARDWAASDRGRRLDHIWLSPALKGTLADHAIRKEMRGWMQPSDHVPVLATLAV